MALTFDEAIRQIVDLEAALDAAQDEAANERRAHEAQIRETAKWVNRTQEYKEAYFEQFNENDQLLARVQELDKFNTSLGDESSELYMRCGRLEGAADIALRVQRFFPDVLTEADEWMLDKLQPGDLGWDEPAPNTPTLRGSYYLIPMRRVVQAACDWAWRRDYAYMDSGASELLAAVHAYNELVGKGDEK